MSLDGLMTRNILNELNNEIDGGKIDKIYQPENDTIILHIRSNKKTHKLLLSSNAKYPRIHFTQSKYENPLTAPMFCMVLRKHISGGKITKLEQHSLDRIVELSIETLNEFKDLVTYKLTIEMMGKHSNIILRNDKEIIEDSITHVSGNMSSVRKVMPKFEYSYPPNLKANPLTINEANFKNLLSDNFDLPIGVFFYKHLTGFSPLISKDLCTKSNVDFNTAVGELNSTEVDSLFGEFKKIIDLLLTRSFNNYIMSDKNNTPIDFYCLNLFSNKDFSLTYFDSPSEMIESFYYKKDIADRLKQKYSDVKKIITNYYERAKRKKILQLKDLEDSKDADIYKTKGELILSNMYNIKKGMDSIEVVNFYDEDQSTLKINLDTNLAPAENSQKYFNKYNKLKRTRSAVITQLKEVDEDIVYFESLLSALNTVTSEDDINEIRYELAAGGYIKKQNKGKKTKQIKSNPLHYISSDGFNMYVGKNNIQNDNLTLKVARSYDLWFHTKDIPGSHVIIKTDNKDVPDSTIYEACLLAAYHSKARGSSNIPVDYTQRKNVKKPSGAKPGFVIYLQNQTKFVTPTEENLPKLHEKSQLVN